jgi:hypothetical protein
LTITRSLSMIPLGCLMVSRKDVITGVYLVEGSRDGSSSCFVNAVSTAVRLLLRLPVSGRVTPLNPVGGVVGGVSISVLRFRLKPPPPLSSIGLQNGLAAVHGPLIDLFLTSSSSSMISFSTLSEPL